MARLSSHAHQNHEDSISNISKTGKSIQPNRQYYMFYSTMKSIWSENLIARNFYSSYVRFWQRPCSLNWVKPRSNYSSVKQQSILLLIWVILCLTHPIMWADLFKNYHAIVYIKIASCDWESLHHIIIITTVHRELNIYKMKHTTGSFQNIWKFLRDERLKYNDLGARGFT